MKKNLLNTLLCGFLATSSLFANSEGMTYGMTNEKWEALSEYDKLKAANIYNIHRDLITGATGKSFFKNRYYWEDIHNTISHIKEAYGDVYANNDRVLKTIAEDQTEEKDLFIGFGTGYRYEHLAFYSNKLPNRYYLTDHVYNGYGKGMCTEFTDLCSQIHGLYLIDEGYRQNKVLLLDLKKARNLVWLRNEVANRTSEKEIEARLKNNKEQYDGWKEDYQLGAALDEHIDTLLNGLKGKFKNIYIGVGTTEYLFDNLIIKIDIKDVESDNEKKDFVINAPHDNKDLDTSFDRAMFEVLSNLLTDDGKMYVCTFTDIDQKGEEHSSFFYRYCPKTLMMYKTDVLMPVYTNILMSIACGSGFGPKECELRRYSDSNNLPYHEGLMITEYKKEPHNSSKK